MVLGSMNAKVGPRRCERLASARSSSRPRCC